MNSAAFAARAATPAQLDAVAGRVVVPYERIPHFPRPSVEGHRGNLILGSLSGVPVVVFQGRFHHYEGHDLEVVTRPVRLARALGADTLILSAATGGIAEGLRPGDPDRAALIRALDRTYEATLDCPELCGLRDTADVLESHRSTGVFDPALWWLVFLNEQPHGCMLLNRCPDHGTVELVYLGLSPELRSRRIGSRLLELGLAAIDSTGGTPITCAVDLRNAPALRLYGRLGFREFGRRVALVRPIGG